MSRKQKIVIELCPNPKVVVFHCTSILCKTFEHVGRDDFYADDFPPTTEKTKELFRQIFRIPGITKIYAQPYELSIYKSPAFDWDALIKQIKPVLFTQFNVSPERIDIVE